MGLFRATTTMTANGTAEPLEGDNLLSQRWKDRQVPNGGLVELAMICTDANVVVTVQSGPEILLEECPVGSGGTIGVFPSFQDTVDLVDEVAEGDLIKIRLRETAGGTPSVMTALRYSPQ